MECQLAKYIKRKEHPERLGWFVWVKVERPTLRASSHIETGRKFKPSLLVHSPYFNPRNKKGISISMDCIELLPYGAEFSKRISWDKFIERQGEKLPE